MAQTNTPRRGLLNTFLAVIERGGNALPHPSTLFLLFALGVIALSAVAAGTGLEAEHPGTGELIRPFSLMSLEGLHMILTKMVSNFTGFAPLGTVLVALLGIGIAESSGLIGACLRLLVLSAPRKLLTVVIVFSGVMSNMASEIGYVLLVPLAALIFRAAGRHPIAGLAAAFAGVSGGYSANLALGTVDPLLSGLTQEAARIVDPDAAVNPACNYYFMLVSTFLVTLVGTLVTELVVVPRLGAWKGDAGERSGAEDAEQLRALSPEERRGLWSALAVGLLYALGLFLSVLPDGARVQLGPTGLALLDPLAAALTALLNGLLALCLMLPHGFLLDPQTGDVFHSPFMKSIVALIFVGGALLGLAYGVAARTVRNDSEAMAGMAKSMETLGGYLVLVFFAAQFVAYFNWTNLGLILAVKGADALGAMELGGVALMLCFVLLSGIINLFMGSASAKWALMAPVFVPMMMLLGYPPELTQAAYRIGDSTTNIISPMMSYFALIIAFFQRWEPRAGIGTLVATMLPYSLAFLVGWSVLLVAWMLLELPLGPG